MTTKLTKKYDIIDNQLGDYYEENITLAQAKEIGIRLVERSMLEQGEKYVRQNAQMLVDVQNDKTEEDVAETLAMSDHTLTPHIA